MLNYKRGFFRYLIAIIGVLLLFVYVVIHIQRTNERLDKNFQVLVDQNVKTGIQTIEASVGFAESRIRVIANNLSMAMQTPDLQQPQYVLTSYLERGPFSFIEYVNADGINVIADGTKINASNMVYYKEGMKGKSGVWANFSPAKAKEVLLNCYTPLYHNSQVVGVLTGVLGGDSNLKALMKQDFFGEPCYNVVCDAKGRIITSNINYALGQTLENLLTAKGLTKVELQEIAQRMAEKSRETFKLQNGSSYTLVSFNSINDLDFYVLQIVPSSTISSIKNSALYSYYGILVALVLLLILISIVYIYDDRMQNAIKNANKELEISTAISQMYNSLHIIDLPNDAAEEYLSPDVVHNLAEQKEKASEKIFFVMEHLAKPEWKDPVLSFVDFTTLQERLENQNFIMLDFEGIHFWVRSFFSVMERDENNQVLKVIFATRVIDQYMKNLQQLHRKSNVDQLTGLLNRTAYEDNLREHADVSLPKDFVYASIDVNGLKNINDSLGHAAGDELLQGAANCLKCCLGSYGSVYRMGGDEFAALLFVDDAKMETIKNDLDATVRAWHGKMAKELHFASGYASKAQYPDADLAKLGAIADKLMYAEKERFYSQKGFDRRRQRYAFDVICSSYTKILRVNLTEDNYTIIRLDESEINNPFRPDRISEWLESFGKSKRIYGDDRKRFLESTQLEKLRDFFIKGKDKQYSVYYRREINGVYRNVMMEIIAANDYSDDNQVVYLLIKDIGKSNL